MLSKENRFLARWDPGELLVNLQFYITALGQHQFEVRTITIFIPWFVVVVVVVVLCVFSYNESGGQWQHSVYILFI